MDICILEQFIIRNTEDVEESGNSSKLVTANGIKTMKNPRAYEVISKQREQRKERNGKNRKEW